MSDHASSGFEQQEFKDALAQYEEMIKGNTTSYFDADQFADFAEFYASQSRYDDASQVIDYALNIHPGNSDILIVKAHILIDLDKVDEAKTIVHIIGEDSVDLILLKAELLLYDNKADEAEALLNDMLITRNDIEKEDYVDVAYLFWGENMELKAVEWFTKAAELYPKDAYIKMDMASCYTEAEEMDKAIDIYNKLLDENPYHPDYWYELGKVYYIMGDYNKAIEAYEFVLTIVPLHPRAQLMMAHCYFKLENYEESAQYYLKYSNWEPESEMPYFFCGLCYFTMEKYDTAMEYFAKALEASQKGSPQLIDIYSYIALTYSKQGRTEDAMYFIDRAISQDEDCAESYVYKGRFYLILEDKDNATLCFEKALLIDPDDLKTYNDIGSAYFECKDYQTALPFFQKMIEIDPSYGLTSIYLAYLYLQLGDKDNFQVAFTKAVEESPEKIIEFLEFLPEEDTEVKQLILNLKTTIEGDLQEKKEDSNNN